MMVIIVSLLYILPIITGDRPIIEEVIPSAIMQKTSFSEDGYITVKGENLANIDKLYIGKQEITDINIIDDNEIKFILPEEYYNDPGKLKIKVDMILEDVLTKTSNTFNIDILSLGSINQPIITTISPEIIQEGVAFNEINGNNYLIISGENFDKNSRIVINDKIMETTILDDENTLRTKVPYELSALNKKMNVYIKQLYNGYETQVISNVVTIPIAVDEDKVFKHEYGWIQENYLIAHALGGVNKSTYTNSLEAFKENYRNGHRTFEVDLVFTSDDVLVGRHYWENETYDSMGHDVPIHMKNLLPQSYDELMQYPSEYTLLTFEDICQLMNEYQDIYMVTDTKEKEAKAVEKTFDYIVKMAQKIDSSVLDRLIIQVYDQAMYKRVMEIYPFKSVIYTLYNSPDTNEEVLKFVKNTGIKVITMPVDRATQDFVQQLNKLGCYVYIHTVNDISTTKEYIERGVYGVYTDFINYENLSYNQENYYEVFTNKVKFSSTEMDIYNYLTQLNNEDYIVIFSIKDEGTCGLNQRVIHKLQELGLTANLIGNDRSSYLAVLDGTNVIVEELGYQMLEKDIQLANIKIEVVSAGFDYGNIASIKVDDIEYAINNRGLNIVVYDKKTERVVDSICFDTHLNLEMTKEKQTTQSEEKEIEETRTQYMVEYLEDATNPNYITILSIKDEGVAAINDTIANEFYRMGFREDFRDKLRMSYIGVINSEKVIFEKFSEEAQEITMEIDGVLLNVASAGYEKGNYSSIIIDGKEYSVNSRGLNIVVYDKTLGRVIGSICFDTHGNLQYSR